MVRETRHDSLPDMTLALRVEGHRRIRNTTVVISWHNDGQVDYGQLLVSLEHRCHSTE